MDRIFMAIEFASKAHGDQKRKYTGEPYIYHPIAVMEKLRALKFHESFLIAAILHDTVEDTDVDIMDIVKRFGPPVARIVDDLTDKFTPEFFPKFNRAQRKKMECDRLSKTPAYVKTIKLADIIDNTPSIVEHGGSFAPIYISEMIDLLPALKAGDERLFDEALELIYDAKQRLRI